MTALNNHYATLPESFYTHTQPAAVPAPRLLAWNAELAATLGLAALADDPDRLPHWFSGNALPPGAQPIALAYAGHQFGHFVPQLGDGRALLLGDVVAPDGRRFDIQLKGSGRTPFSRGGDGKSWLGPVIREFVVSEAMHHLGVPTTRALAAVATGEPVLRETIRPGGVLTRVASSHIRVGTFEYFAARGDADAVRRLADYAIDRHYPHARETDSPYVALFNSVCAAQAALIAHWMAIGFIHGVMNTDNTSIAGETIDYGPCAFMDEFRRDKVFSSIDHHGRYAYDQQARIGQWNLTRLAECLLLLDDDQPVFEAGLERFASDYEQHYLRRMRHKLGLLGEHDDDAGLIEAWLQHLEAHELDYTLGFRRLAERAGASDIGEFGDFETAWRARLSRQDGDAAAVRERMNAANPLFIPRNHQVERAIANAVDGDLSTFEALNAVLSKPYTEQAGYEAFAAAPLPAERVTETFCGT
jgi:uncharacterized protein YdiU (UPF0061 family)